MLKTLYIKKRIILISALFLVFMCCGCSQGDVDNSNRSTSSETENDTSYANNQDLNQDDVDDVEENENTAEDDIYNDEKQVVNSDSKEDNNIPDNSIDAKNNDEELIDIENEDEEILAVYDEYEVNDSNDSNKIKNDADNTKSNKWRKNYNYLSNVDRFRECDISENAYRKLGDSFNEFALKENVKGGRFAVDNVVDNGDIILFNVIQENDNEDIVFTGSFDKTEGIFTFSTI